jgi:hypothetical protein
MVSKLDLAVVAALVAGCAFWIEQGHRITIDAPTESELAEAPSATACPDNDRVPYSVACLAFLKGGSEMETGWRIATTEPTPKALVYSTKRPEPSSASCPDNDSVPYPPDCIKFLSGPFWRPE